MGPLLAEIKETPLVHAYLLSILTRKDTNCSKKNVPESDGYTLQKMA